MKTSRTSLRGNKVGTRVVEWNNTKRVEMKEKSECVCMMKRGEMFDLKVRKRRMGERGSE